MAIKDTLQKNWLIPIQEVISKNPWILKRFNFVCYRVYEGDGCKTWQDNANKVQSRSRYSPGQGTVQVKVQSRSVDSKTEVGIYKRKQESKETRNQELDQENDQENKKKKENKNSTKKVIKKTRKKKENKNLTKKATKKKRKLSWSSSCFLTFLFSLINSDLRCREELNELLPAFQK